MNIGIIGPGNMGKFHAREFVSLGENVSAVLAKTKEKAEDASKFLKENYNISSQSHDSFKNFIDQGKLNAVSICTHLPTHYKFIKDSLNAGFHVMCEKPFVSNLEEAKEVLALAEKKNLIIAVNTQWPGVLESLDIPQEINSFEMTMQPGTLGQDMLEDHLPHMISMLVKLCGEGKVINLIFLKKTEKEIVLSFDYLVKNKTVKVNFNLIHKADRPRKVEFKINQTTFERVVGQNYSQSILINGEKNISIEDPLKTSIKKFVRAIKTGKNPLINPQEILAISEIQEEIIKDYYPRRLVMFYHTNT